MESFKVFWENRNPLSRLYHRTSVDSLITILGSNKFKLTVANSAFERFVMDRRSKKHNHSNHPVYNYKKNYYLSTARSMYNTYYIDKQRYYKRSFAIMELDASKLADRYEIIPVDYWHPSKTPGDTDSKDETEDRVISTKPNINDAEKYITRIFLYVGDDNELQKRQIDIIANCGLPVYVFRKEHDLYLRNIKKAERIEGHNEESNPKELYVPESDVSKDYVVRELNNLYNFIVDPSIENREKITRPIISAEELLNNNIHSKVQEIREIVFKFQELQRRTNTSIRNLLIKTIEKFDKKYN